MIPATPEITIICVGVLKDRNLAALTRTYLDRLRHDARIRIHEISDSSPLKEGEQIARLVEKTGGYSFALSEEGKTYSSRQFAARISAINGNIIFIIGGPSGLSDRIKNGSRELFSLSPLTFTHEIARMLLCEQLYRACSILRNRAYHKG